MRPALEGGPIRRILVGVDASSHSIAAIEEGARIAARLHAELEGVFVEDINLVNLAGYPFAREVMRVTATDRPLDVLAMERQLRAVAGLARAALALAAQDAKVAWTFRVVRGRVTHELLDAARGADLLTLGLSSREGDGRGLLGSTARAAIARGPRSVLLLRQGARSGGPVLVACDGSEGAHHAASLALAIERGDLRRLVLLVLARDPVEASRISEEVARRVAPVGARLRLRQLAGASRQLAGASRQLVERVVHEEGGGLLAVSATSPLLTGDDLSGLLLGLPCPVLVVR